MKLKSYSRVQAFFCYSNPVIEAMCSCWFLNPILFWKGQTASLDALSGYRAPKSGELPASFQTSSAKWGDKGICNRRSSLKGMIPIWNEGRRGAQREAAEAWEGRRHIGHGGAMLILSDGYWLSPKFRAVTSWCERAFHSWQGFFLFHLWFYFLQTQNCLGNRSGESLTFSSSWEVPPRGCITNNVSGKQGSTKGWLQEEGGFTKSWAAKKDFQPMDGETHMGLGLGNRYE